MSQAVSHLLVLLVVISPVELPLTPTASVDTWRSVMAVARALELWDRDESWAESFRGELRWLRNQWWESWDHPPLADSHLLPDLATCVAAREFASKHHVWLEAQATGKLWRQAELDDWRCEAGTLDRAWMLAAYAADPGYAPYARRRHLYELKLLLGNQYPLLPPPVPMWRFCPVN